MIDIVGLPDELTREVRATMRSPGYGHPAMHEVAQGTGPCRACLEPFTPGADERILFTYRPRDGAPGPVFIHAHTCQRYAGDVFPPSLHAFPIILEGRTPDGRVPLTRHIRGADADAAIAELFADADVAFIHVRHGQAGCHIARVDRSVTPPLAPA